MTRFARLVGACAWLVAGGALADDAGMVDDGRALAERLCSRCHAIEGPGPSPLAAAPLFSGFARRWPIESLAEAMAEGLTVGHGPMPEFTFSIEEIDALLAYLQSVQR